MLGLIVAIMVAAATPGGPAPQDSSWSRFDEADSRLGAAYEALMAHLSGEPRLSLRASERDWIVARNRACGFEAKNQCAERRTEERIAFLETNMAQTKTFEGMSAPQLFQLEARLSDACRSGAEDVEGPICTRRYLIVHRLAARGWCWGPDDSIEAERRWMRSGPSCHN